VLKLLVSVCVVALSRSMMRLVFTEQSLAFYIACEHYSIRSASRSYSKIDLLGLVEGLE